MFGGIMSVLAFGKMALADEVPVIKGDDGKYDISCIVQAPEGSNWITHYFGKVPFEITSVDEKNPKASVESINIPDADSMGKGGAKFDSVKKMWTAKISAKTTPCIKTLSSAPKLSVSKKQAIFSAIWEEGHLLQCYPVSLLDLFKISA